MIISYLHNYIYIKTKKTAGTTVEAVLAPMCGPDDVVTLPVAEARGEVLVRNIHLDPERAAEFREFQKAGGKRPPKEVRVAARKSGKAFFNHMSAEEAYPLIDREFWDSAFKFTTERHPYEKAVSMAYFRMNKSDQNKADFDACLDRVLRGADYPGFPRWSVNGKVAMDDFVKLENLKQDLARVGARLGIPIPEELPKKKGKIRLDPRPAREILSDEQKEIVYERCAEEFEILGWER